MTIVTEAAGATPQLHRIQNPAAHFRMDEDIFATGFIVPEDKWRDKASADSNRSRINTDEHRFSLLKGISTALGCQCVPANHRHAVKVGVVA